MLADFDHTTLPIDKTHAYDTGTSVALSSSKWRYINAAAATLILKCLKLPVPVGGWMPLDNNIAVFMLPSGSLMRFYWANDLVLRKSHRVYLSLSDS